MQTKFTTGVIAGASSLLLGASILAQTAGAASSASSVAGDAVNLRMRGPLTQEQVQQMADRDKTFVSGIDALAAAAKSAIQTRAAALDAAADIADETARQDAVKAAMEAFHTSMKATIEANPALQGMMSFGKGMRGPGHHMKMGRGPGSLADKLGMTREELKTAIESGKTIEEIAGEKGVELPEKPMFGNRHMRMMNDDDDDNDESSSDQ